LDQEGSFLAQFGGLNFNTDYGIADGQLFSPQSTTLDSTDNLYIADTANNRIQKLSPTGTFLLKFGSFGTGNGQFNSPHGIVLDSSGNIYVADYNNNRIQKFDPTGTFVSTWG